jgi:hypothetical protein
MKKTRYFKALGCIFLLGVMILLNLNLVSAELFQFDNVKSYDSVKQEITITNTFGLGSEIAKIQLHTPTYFEVPVGYQKVAEFTINSLSEEYTNPLEELKFFDLNSNSKEINKQFDYKYLKVEDIVINDYKLTCEDNINGTKNYCYNEVVGSHTEKVESWETLDTAKLTKGVYKIGIFTQVNLYDKVEWIPTYYGVKIEEWAIYVQSSGTYTTYLDGSINYSVYTFTSNGSFNVTNNLNISVLVVAGGGGGGGGAGGGGGGGAGGVVFNNSYNLQTGNYSVVVGRGGAGVSGDPSNPQNGTYSSFDQITAVGGGGGGLTATSPRSSSNGGSGGGTGSLVATALYGDSIQTNNSYGFAYGNRGGNSTVLSQYGGGGGGGAGGVGGDGGTLNGGNGGSGVGFNIYNGTTLYYGGGGGGGLNGGGGSAGLGGLGGGANGGKTSIGNNATNGTGGGGGAGGSGNLRGGDGGSGIVIIRFNTADLNPVSSNLTIIQNSPTNFYNFTTNNITLDSTIILPDNSISITNVSLLINGVINQTNTSGINGSYLYNFNLLGDGKYTWSVRGFDNNSVEINSNTLTFWINTAPQINNIAPVNNSNLTYNSVYFNSTILSTYNVKNVSLYINGVLNQTNSSTINGTYSFNTFLGDGSYLWYLTACSTGDSCNTSALRNISIDSTLPKITITNPTNTTYYTNITKVNNVTHTYNWTTIDLHRDKCWFSVDDGATNKTLTCDSNYSLGYPYGTQTFIAWSNDTFGNINTSRVTATWDYRVFENSRVVPAVVTEGSTQTFSINLTAHTPVTSAYLNYNGSRQSVSITAGAFTTLSSSIAIPTINANGQAIILWEINTGEGYFNSTSNITNVTNMNIDNCSVNQFVIYNFTMYDEINLSKSVNNSAKLNLQIYPTGSSTAIIDYNHLYNGTYDSLYNPFAVCINASFNSGENYRIDTEVEYTSLSSSIEFYHIQKETLNSSYLKNISLYDLDNLHSTTFKIIYKDDSYNPIEDALVEIKRKYVEEGVFKVVEIPLTDYNGETLASLQTNDVIYSFRIIKNGVVLDTFNNLFVKCSNPLTDECIIPLNSVSPYVDTEDYTTGDDFSYSISYNRTTRIISVSYSIPSGNSSTVVLNSTLTDNVGTIVACSDSLTSSSGTLSCTVPNGVGNQSIIAYVYKDNVLQGYSIADMRQSASDIYGNNLFFLLLFLYLTIIGISIGDNPMVTGIFLVIGAVLGIAVNLVNGSFIGRSATVLWLIIAIVIVLIKGGKRT